MASRHQPRSLLAGLYSTQGRRSSTLVVAHERPLGGDVLREWQLRHLMRTKDVWRVSFGSVALSADVNSSLSSNLRREKFEQQRRPHSNLAMLTSPHWTQIQFNWTAKMAELADKNAKRESRFGTGKRNSQPRPQSRTGTRPLVLPEAYNVVWVEAL